MYLRPEEDMRGPAVFAIALGNGRKWNVHAANDATLKEVWDFIKFAVPHGIFAVITAPNGDQKQFLRGVD